MFVALKTPTWRVRVCTSKGRLTGSLPHAVSGVLLWELWLVARLWEDSMTNQRAFNNVSCLMLYYRFVLLPSKWTHTLSQIR